MNLYRTGIKIFTVPTRQVQCTTQAAEVWLLTTISNAARKLSPRRPYIVEMATRGYLTCYNILQVSVCLIPV